MKFLENKFRGEILESPSEERETIFILGFGGDDHLVIEGVSLMEMRGDQIWDNLTRVGFLFFNSMNFPLDNGVILLTD